MNVDPEVRLVAEWSRKIRLRKRRAKVACLEEGCPRCKKKYPGLVKKMAELRQLEARS